MRLLARDAVRMIRRNPVLSLVAVASLSIGMTINATAFSLIDGLVLRPLPIADPDHLVGVRTLTPTSGAEGGVSYEEFRDIQTATKTLAQVAAFQTAGTAVGEPGHAPAVETLGIVSSNYFSMLGVSATLGRVFGDIDRDVSRGTPGVVVSYRYWQRQLAGDPTVIGRPIRLNTRPWIIVGVLPERFDGTQPLLPPAIWATTEAFVASGRSMGTRDNRSFTALGRLAPGVTIEQANAEMRAIAAGLAAQYPDGQPERTLTADFESRLKMRRNVWVVLTLALVIASLPLLIACANITGLLLGRAEERRREMAIRLALGASRARLVRQLLTETATLSLLAVLVSLVLALWILRLIPALMPSLPIEFGLDLRIDLRVALATFGVALVATLAAGLAPALMASRPDLSPIIKGVAGPTLAVGRRRVTLRNALVTGQIAVMFLLLELAALFTMSLVNANRVDPGFAPGAMAFATVAPGAIGYTRAQSDDFYARLIERVRQRPTIEAATFARHVPLNSFSGAGALENVTIPGQLPPGGRGAFAIRQNVVSAGYFDTMGIRLLRGRDFDGRDRRDGERVAIINDTMARRFWPNDDPVGRRVMLVDQPCVIIGVAADAKYLTLQETTPPYMYFPQSQRPAGEITLIARGHGDETVLAGELRRTIAEISPDLPAIDIITRTEHMHRALFGERALAGSITGLGAVSLALAMVGIYGVMAFAVSRRTREIGIEMAIGATPHRILMGILKSGARLTGAGILIGASAGFALTAMLAGGLYGVNQNDPRIFLAAAAITLPVALAASYVPARRAAKIDPITAIRE